LTCYSSLRYEFTIAVAENAVDNGVSLRLRRQVTSILPDDGGGDTLTVHMDHWEPAAYLENMPAASTALRPSSSSPPLRSSALRRIIIAAAAAVALAVIAVSLSHVFAGIPFLLPFVSRAQAAACSFLVAFSFVAVFFDGPASLSHMRLKNSRDASVAAATPGSNADAVKLAKAATFSVGVGSECVDVADMAMGGSGFKNAVSGRVVEKESVKTRWWSLSADSHVPLFTYRQVHRELRWWLQCSHRSHGRR
jgi:hypothetical protein